jgi:hypothetical protein
MSPQRDVAELRMNAANLYREEMFTDRRVGSIRRLVPVAPDGTADTMRTVLFEGQTTLVTPAGPMPLSFEIDAHTLPEALERFSGAAQLALETMLKELDELRRERASSLIVPGQSASALDIGNLGGSTRGQIRRP